MFERSEHCCALRHGRSCARRTWRSQWQQQQQQDQQQQQQQQREQQCEQQRCNGGCVLERRIAGTRSLWRILARTKGKIGDWLVLIVIFFELRPLLICFSVDRNCWRAACVYVHNSWIIFWLICFSMFDRIILQFCTNLSASHACDRRCRRRERACTWDRSETSWRNFSKF